MGNALTDVFSQNHQT